MSSMALPTPIFRSGLSVRRGGLAPGCGLVSGSLRVPARFPPRGRWGWVQAASHPGEEELRRGPSCGRVRVVLIRGPDGGRRGPGRARRGSDPSGPRLLVRVSGGGGPRPRDRGWCGSYAAASSPGGSSAARCGPVRSSTDGVVVSCRRASMGAGVAGARARGCDGCSAWRAVRTDPWPAGCLRCRCVISRSRRVRPFHGLSPLRSAAGGRWQWLAGSPAPDTGRARLGSSRGHCRRARCVSRETVPCPGRPPWWECR